MVFQTGLQPACYVKNHLYCLLLVVDAGAALEQVKHLEQQLAYEQQQHREMSQVLEGKLSVCEETVTRLTEEIKSKDCNLSEIKMSVEEREKQLATQREEFEAKKLQTVSDLEAANQTIQTLEVEIGNRDTMLQSMHHDVEYKELKLSEVMASYSESHQRAADMEGQLSAGGEEVERLKRELEVSHQQLQQVQAEIEKFHEVSVTVDVFQQLQQQNAKLQFSVTELKGETASLTASLDQSQIECRQLRADLHSTSFSDTQQKDAISSLEAQLKATNTQAQEEISQWKEKMSSVSDQLNSCMAELEQLKDSQRIVAEENESLQAALGGKDDKLRTLNLQLEASEESAHHVRMELEAATSARQMAIGKLERQLEESELHAQEVEEMVRVKEGLATDAKAELEVVRKQLEDMTKQEAERQQVFEDRETLLSNTIATLHQQLEESAANVESLRAKCEENDGEVRALMDKLDDRETKIASLSENLKEEELQLVALGEELETCKARALEDKISAEAEWQKIADSKDAQITTLTESARGQETQMKKYVAVIKKVKQQLQDEKTKREDVEKQSSTSLDDSFTSAEASPAAAADGADNVAQQRITELEQVNKQLMHDISSLESSKSSEYETAITQLNEDVARLKRENETLKGDMENMSVEMRKASDFSGAHMQELSTELSHWKSIAADVEQLRTEISRLESEKSDAIAKAEAMMSERTMLISDIDAKSENIEWLTTQLSDEVAEKQSLKHEINSYKEMQTKMQSECTNMNDERTRLEHQLAVTCDTLQQLSDDNAQLRTTCETLNQELQLLRTEADAARVTAADRVRAEYEEKEAAIKDMQVEVEKLRQASADGNRKSIEEYSVLETENLRLMEQCSTLSEHLEENQNRYEAVITSAAEQEGQVAKETEVLLGRLKLAEEKSTLLEQRLTEVEFDCAKKSDSFKQIQSELESDKQRLEMEVERLTDIVLKSEGTLQQLAAELGEEREEFSLRENELEGTSDELQLEVARLSQKVETDTEELEHFRSRNKEIEMQLNSLASDRDSIERERNEYYEHSSKLTQEYELLRTEYEELYQEKEQLVRELQSNQDVAERKYSALSGQYEMLSTDISNYQELVESLRTKNSQLEQQLQKTSTDDASLIMVANSERERVEHERLLRNDELESLHVRESDLLAEIKRLQLQIEEYSNTEEELSESQSKLLELQSRVFALQTENYSLQRHVGDLEQRVQELTVIESEQSALQERYLVALQDNSALIRQSKEMYEKLRSFNELTENSDSQSAAEVSALRAEVETLRSKRESVLQKDLELERLRAELLALKAVAQRQTTELQALRASAYRQSSSDGFESRESVHLELPAVDHYHGAERQPELALNEEAARVYVVPVHSSPTAHKITSVDRPHEVSRLKSQVTKLLFNALTVVYR